MKMNVKSKDQRFIVKDEQTLGGNILRVIVDTQTGVNYIATGAWGATDIVPLLDVDGKVFVDKK